MQHAPTTTNSLLLIVPVKKEFLWHPSLPEPFSPYGPERICFTEGQLVLQYKHRAVHSMSLNIHWGHQGLSQVWEERHRQCCSCPGISLSKLFISFIVWLFQKFMRLCHNLEKGNCTESSHKSWARWPAICRAADKLQSAFSLQRGCR